MHRRGKIARPRDVKVQRGRGTQHDEHAIEAQSPGLPNRPRHTHTTTYDAHVIFHGRGACDTARLVQPAVARVHREKPCCLVRRCGRTDARTVGRELRRGGSAFAGTSKATENQRTKVGADRANNNNNNKRHRAKLTHSPRTRKSSRRRRQQHTQRRR